MRYQSAPIGVRSFAIDSLESRKHFASTGAIAGSVYFDIAANGTIESVDVKAPDVVIYIDKNRNGLLDTSERRTTTDTEGNYRFDSLGAGTFRLGVQLGTGYRQVSPASGTLSVTLTNNQRVSGRNFLITGTGSIAGTVRNVANNAGLSGWGIYLDLNGNNSRDANETRYVTRSNGAYTIPNVPPGTWVVRQVRPSGWTLTNPPAGEFVIRVAAGQRATGVDFSNRNNSTAGAVVRGFAFQDFNGDGARNGSESALADLFIRVRNTATGTFFDARTDSAGNYSLSNITAGRWEVRVATSSLLLETTFPASDVYILNVTGSETFSGRDFGVRSTI
jgi:serine-aspartate repeat-containing protein C/D/E